MILIKNFDTKPTAVFFRDRLSKFIENMDATDYRCKIIKHGLVKVLYVIQKSYIKYLTDNYRLITADEVSLDDLKRFCSGCNFILWCTGKSYFVSANWLFQYSWTKWKY